MADFVLNSVMHDRFCTQFTQCEFRVLSLYSCIVNALLAGLPSRSFRRYHILPFAARESTRSSARCHRPTSPLIFQTRALARNTASAHHVRSSHAETSPARLPERRTHPRPRSAHVRAAGLPVVRHSFYAVVSARGVLLRTQVSFAGGASRWTHLHHDLRCLLQLPRRHVFAPSAYRVNSSVNGLQQAALSLRRHRLLQQAHHIQHPAGITLPSTRCPAAIPLPVPRRPPSIPGLQCRCPASF